MIYRIGLTLCFISFLVLSNTATAQTQGDEILSQYKNDLQKALRLGLSKGVVEAISTCSIEAPKIADSLSHNKISVGRASHRLRNPKNAPPEWVEPILNAYIKNAADREPKYVSLPESRIGYVEPIVLQPICTTCHGENIADEVTMRISKLYPDDQAVGFKVGDIRGVFWASYPSEK